MNLIEQLEQEEIARLGKTIPEFAPGDTVIVIQFAQGFPDWTVDRNQVIVFPAVEKSLSVDVVVRLLEVVEAYDRR